MTTHSFTKEEAEEHGISSAIVLAVLREFLTHFKQYEENKFEGYVWVKISARQFKTCLPYMNETTIRRHLRLLKEKGLIKMELASDAGRDQIKWFTIPREYKL